jgi:hypothetical protein
MAEIEIQEIDDQTFQVTVAGGTTTTHRVTLTADYYRKLTGGRVAPGELVRKSFEFLLARESNTSILRSFELSVIGRYFPEYERTIGEKLG